MKFLIILILALTPIYLFGLSQDRENLIKMAQEIEERVGRYEDGLHCVTIFNDDGSETTTCQSMKDVKSTPYSAMCFVNKAVCEIK